jgi:hypothetical protein
MGDTENSRSFYRTMKRTPTGEMFVRILSDAARYIRILDRRIGITCLIMLSRKGCGEQGSGFLTQCPGACLGG